MTDITPSDSRYIPLTQQPACCVPTCFQMVMYRHGIPLVPAEDLGYHLGLVVHPDRKNLFYNVRTSLDKPPSGYGTQIYLSEYEPNHAFKKLNIPLAFTIKSITEFASSAELLAYLLSAEKSDSDVLLCFHHGTLIDNPTHDWGHVCVFDRIVDGQIRLIDPSPDQSKWRIVTAEKMYEAMHKHGVSRSAGIWGLHTV